MDCCKWAVCYKIDGTNYDDKQDREVVTALFRYPFHAEDFIKSIIPQETRSRFYVKRIE